MIYHKDDLAVKQRSDLQIIPNIVVVEISLKRKKVVFIYTYRKHGQSNEQRHDFEDKIDEIIKKAKEENPHCVLIAGDFNAHNSLWYEGDRTDSLGSSLERIFAANGLTQLTNQPTHITGDSRTCIDLTITDQHNLILKNEVHPSLHTNCSHQVVFTKVGINCPPPPNYARHIWHYSRAEVDAMKRSALAFDWDTALSQFNPDEQVKFFNEVIMNISGNFIPNETKIFKPKDPPWLTTTCKSLYLKYRRKFKIFVKNKCPADKKVELDELKSRYTQLVETEKDNYMRNLGRKLANPNTGQKKYWTTLKTILRKNIVSRIPPILIDNCFIVEAEEKCNFFNEFFRKQCIVPITSSKLPTLIKTTPLSIENVIFSEDDITRHIKKLNPNKSHGHDNLSIKIIQMFGQSISKPLFIIYSNCIRQSYFPKTWKMGNVIPVYKKNEKNLMKNYRPISLLPICGKLFEKLIFDNLYNYVFSNNFISDKQSGYRRGDSTVKQLISITHEIHKAFDSKNEIRAVFLDISKAFDTVWHEGLIHKLKRIGIEGEMIGILNSFLSDRKQRVTIDGKNSDWAEVQAGVPQGSLLGPLLFLIYINDIVEVVNSEIRIFADDTFIFTVVNEHCTETLNKDLESINKWAWQWKMVFNPDITKQAVEIQFSRKRTPTRHDELSFNGIPVKKVKETKHLGMVLDEKLSFTSHIGDKITKAKKELGVMKHIKKWVPFFTLVTYYKMWIRPHLEYADLVFDKASHSRLQNNQVFNLSRSKDANCVDLESIQYQAARIATGAWMGSSMNDTYELLGWETLEHRRTIRKLTELYRILKEKSPNHLYEIITPFKYADGSRNAEARKLINMRSNREAFFPSVIEDWNRLEKSVKESNSKNIFKKKLLNKARPKRKLSYYGISDNNKIRYLTMLRLKMSPLKSHKFENGFLDTHDGLCRVCGSVEDNKHFLTLCRSFADMRTDLYNAVTIIIGEDASIIPPTTLVKMFLYGKKDATDATNKTLLEEVTKYIKKTKRFDKVVPDDSST